MEENTSLKRIKIEGFKSIAKLDLPMENINILIGANGAGKTNFISLFTFLNHLSNGRLTTYVEAQGFANNFFHFGSKQTSQITIDLDVGKVGYHVLNIAKEIGLPVLRAKCAGFDTWLDTLEAL